MRVDSITEAAEGVVSLKLEAAYGNVSLPRWQPGAHIDFKLSPTLVRQYSLCGDPQTEDTWQIAVLKEPNGLGGSRFVHETLREGDVVATSMPRNNFPLESSSNYIFIAGGIGITPILPMISQVSASGAQWQLLYGGRTAGSMAFTAELQNLPGANVSLVPEDMYGLLDLEGVLGSPQYDTMVYCCGPEPLLTAVEQQCESWPQGALRMERFVTASKPTLEAGAFEVEVASSGDRFVVPADTPLLDALEECGFDIVNSCRAGICGTCLTKVIDGEPEHNDDVLTDEERSSNDLILPCVSRSKSDLIVLDL